MLRDDTTPATADANRRDVLASDNKSRYHTHLHVTTQSCTHAHYRSQHAQYTEQRRVWQQCERSSRTGSSSRSVTCKRRGVTGDAVAATAAPAAGGGSTAPGGKRTPRSISSSTARLK
jgi:hypothetical protein